MKKSLIASGLGVLIIVLAASVLQAQKATTSSTTKEVIYAEADKASFKQGLKPGALMATLWGNPDQSAHGTFTKFAPGFDAGMHIHTNDIWIVVIKGAYLYKDDRAKSGWERDFVRVPGGHSIGATAIRRKALYFTRKPQGSSIPCLQIEAKEFLAATILSQRVNPEVNPLRVCSKLNQNQIFYV